MLSDADVKGSSRDAGAARPVGRSETLHKLGRYDIERKLGAGGMGAVYLARDTKLRRQVALKVLPKDKANNPVLVRRFEAEAQASAQLRHENIVAVYDSGKVEGFLYIAMEYVDGIDLHELIARRGTIPVKRSIEIVKQAASALQHAAEHKIVHRDIKPSNLLIRRDGAVKLTDLGLARSIDDTIETGITRAGTTVGTVDYMSPEQARSSKAADIRSDIYSLGCTWYHMLTGEPPYGEGSLTNKLQAHASKPLPDPRTVNPNVTDALVAVLHRMIAKNPEDRYQTPAELLSDLESSTLTHAAFSNEIFQAIEEEKAETARTDATSTESPRARSTVSEDESDDDESDESASAVGHGESKTLRRTGPQKTLPPPRRKPIISDNDEESAGDTVEKLKLAGLIGGVIAAVCALGWLASGLGGLFDSPDSLVVTPAAPPPTVIADPTIVTAVGPEGVVAPGVNAGGAPQITAPIVSGADNSLTVGSANAVATALNPGSTPPGTGTGLPVGPTVGVSQPALKLPDDPTKRPEDRDPASAVAKLPVWTVGVGNPSATHFPTLNEALSMAGDQAVAIKLLGRGPFLLSHATPLRLPHLHLMADGQSTPLLVLSNNADGSPGRIHVIGNLSIDGVHIVIDRQASSSTTPVAMIAAENGHLSLQSSSLTAIQTGPAPLTAVAVQSSAQPPRVTVSQTAIRGEFDVGFDLVAPSVDVAVQDSLIAVGNGTALRFRGEGPANPSHQPLRLVRSFSSTWTCRGSLVNLTSDKDLDPAPPTHVVWVDTVASTGEGTGPQTLLDAAGWPQSRLRESLFWKNDNSAFLGFETLIDLGAASSFKAMDADGWKLFWRQAVESREFSGTKWPTGVANLAGANPSDFGRDVIPTAIRTASVRGLMPGAPAERLSVPESVYPERMVALAKRTAFAPLAWLTSAPIKVDLRKQDLGMFLAKGEWPDRTVIEASGYGVCTMTPVSLVGKQVKIVFHQVDGGPLRLFAKDPTKPADGLFQVREGALELEGLRWQVPEVKPSTPRWLVSAVDSRVTIRDCELTVPDAATAPFEGVIRFESTATADRVNRPQLGLFDSFLHAPGTLIRAEASDGCVFVHNCVLVARGVVFDSRPRPIAGRLPLTYDLTNCTLSAQNTLVKVSSAASLEGPAASPSRWFVDNCVIAPPLELKAAEATTPTVLTFVGDVIGRKEFEWWGRSNGAAREIKYWLRPDGSLPTPEKSNHEAWLTTWGDAHELHLLTGEGGVILRDPLPTRREEVKVGHFALRPSCKAMAWAEGRPIGAVFGAETTLGPKTTPKSSPATNPKTNPPNSKAVPKTLPGRPGF
jgi:serine/threonine protein kinase